MDTGFRRIRAAQSPRLIQAGSSGPLAVLLIKLEVTIIDGGELALDEEVAHLRGDLERVAGGDDEIGNLAGFQRAEFFVEAEDLRRHKRDRLEGFVVRQPVGDSVGGKLAEAPPEGVVKAGEGNLDAGGGKLRRLGH